MYWGRAQDVPDGIFLQQIWRLEVIPFMIPPFFYMPRGSSRLDVNFRCFAHLLQDRYNDSYVVLFPQLARGSLEMRTKLVILLCPHLQV